MAASDNLSPEQHGALVEALKRASDRWKVPSEAFRMTGIRGSEVTMETPGKFWGPRTGRVEHTFDVSTPDVPQVELTEFTHEGFTSSSMSPSAREAVVGLYDYRDEEGRMRTDKLPWNPGLTGEND